MTKKVTESQSHKGSKVYTPKHLLCLLGYLIIKQHGMNKIKEKQVDLSVLDTAMIYTVSWRLENHVK